MISNKYVGNFLNNLLNNQSFRLVSRNPRESLDSAHLSERPVSDGHRSGSWKPGCCSLTGKKWASAASTGSLRCSRMSSSLGRNPQTLCICYWSQLWIILSGASWGRGSSWDSGDSEKASCSDFSWIKDAVGTLVADANMPVHSHLPFFFFLILLCGVAKRQLGPSLNEVPNTRAWTNMSQSSLTVVLWSSLLVGWAKHFLKAERVRFISSKVFLKTILIKYI